MSPLRILLIICLSLCAYSFMLSSSFKTMDDQYSIVGNPLIKDSSQWPEIFKQGYFGDRSYYRPLVNLSFMAEYKVFGLNSFFYNFDNLLIHIANALLVWMLVALLVQNASIGFWVGLLFAIHPIHWEAVANISGRAILLSTLFCLISFIAHLKGRRLLSLISFAAALLCKESAAVLPGIIFVHDFANKKDLRWVWASGGVIVAYIALRHFLGITEVFPWRNVQEQFLGVLTFLRSMITNLRLFILPVDLHFDRSLKLFSSVFEAGALMTIFVWMVALGWLGVSIRKLGSIHWVMLAWFILQMLPVSQVVTTIGVQPGSISTAEHFLYMASVPVFVAMVMFGVWAVAKIKTQKASLMIVAQSIVLSFMAFLFLTTVTQSVYAKDESVMLMRSLAIQPDNARLQFSVGLMNALNGDFGKAEGHFRHALKADPENARYKVSFARSLCDQKKWIQCLGQSVDLKDAGQYHKLLERNTTLSFTKVQEEIASGKVLDEQGWFILGAYYAKAMDVDRAIDAFGKAVVFNPKNADALFNLASLYEARQQWVLARGHYENFLNLSSTSVALQVHARNHLKQIEAKQEAHEVIHTQ